MLRVHASEKNVLPGQVRMSGTSATERDTTSMEVAQVNDYIEASPKATKRLFQLEENWLRQPKLNLISPSFVPPKLFLWQGISLWKSGRGANLLPRSPLLFGGKMAGFWALSSAPACSMNDHEPQPEQRLAHSRSKPS